MSDTPLAELLDSATKEALGDVHVGGVGTVTSYDHSSQTATVQPVVRSRFVDPDTGEPEFIQPPPIPNVPVQFPSGGGYSIVWPLEKGDVVYLCQADKSHDEWQANDGDDKSPQDPRRFDLTDSFAFPTGKSPANPVGSNGIDSDAMVVQLANELHLGKSNPASWVARADRTAKAIKGQEDLYKTHTHNYVAPLIPSSPTPNTPPNQQPTPTKEADVKSDKVRTD